MKRYWYLMAIAATLLASCNKDEEETEIQGFKVLEYRPAPGQFINEGFDCQTMEEANAYAEERFNKKLYVSLGSFGGYITIKMPKEITAKDTTSVLSAIPSPEVPNRVSYGYPKTLMATEKQTTYGTS